TPGSAQSPRAAGTATARTRSATCAVATSHARAPKRSRSVLQDVLAEDEWARLLTAEDHRGLTPLFWQHVLPYGEVKLDMAARLSIRTTAPPGASGVDTQIPSGTAHR